MYATNTPATCIRILIADDHPLMREGIRALIEDQTDMAIVAQASNGEETVAGFLQHRPDVLLVDIQMPGLDGITAMQQIRQHNPQARVIILTTYRGDAQITRALEAGAASYLLKSMVGEELLDTIRTVHQGRRKIHTEIAQELAEHYSDDNLSGRELAVLTEVAKGNSNKRVAQALDITEETVKAHLKRILQKLGASNRSHAIVIAVKRGIIIA